ncbi:MAG: hypothetical protein GF317_06930, partial [Candidatus Lokiarchaeota archaeon]|nr:hypothetical protein [Candidatus Lokiarchaeota archaeon]MBD3199443.1 hypothetical protein [Candidatus Lokiarchaeota archaeon]
MASQIPEKIIKKWQKIVNILAKIAGVPVALIMKVDRPYIEVFRSSETKENPYEIGGREHLSGLYCERVLNTKSKLLVADAINNHEWNKNPDIKLGMISYLGFPLEWPNGEIFGTICILDSKKNKYNKLIEDLMLQFREIIESHLELIDKNAHLTELIESQARYQRRIKESNKNYKEAYNRVEFYKNLLTHDINNVFQNFILGIELLKDKFPDSRNNEKISRFFKIFEDQIAKGTRLISNISVLTKLNDFNANLHKIEFCEILKESINNIRNMYQYQEIQITISSIFNEVYLKANNLLGNVIENILLNAIKHNENSRVEIEIRCSKVEENNQTFLKVEFLDNAIGINDERKKKIFNQDLFTKRNTKGMGIGLSLVSELIRMYNGNISVENRILNDYTKGSNFIILL